MIALATFGLVGFGNGLLLVHERLLIQTVVPERLQGRIFAVSDTFVSWAFGIAFLAAGPLLSEIGVRQMLVICGAAGLLVAGLAAFGLRKEWSRPLRRTAAPGRPLEETAAAGKPT
jgi:MFS family permease